VNGFSIAGIRIRVDPSWFFAVLLFAWMLSSTYLPMQVPNYSILAYWLFGTLCALGLFISVLIHELSHCIVARRLGVPVRQITLFIFGGLSEMSQAQSTPSSEFKITIAGPLSSIVTGLVCGGISYMLQGRVGDLAGESLHYLTYINFLLAAFNLIPAFPLDGGRVLRSFLWHRSGNLAQATRSAARIGGGFATVLMGFGFVGLLSGQFMFGIWLVLVGVFLRKSAETEYRSFHARNVLDSFKVGDIMAPPVAVQKGTTVADLINNYIFHYHERIFPVVDRGQFIGMIDLRQLKKLRPEDWPNTYIDAFMSDASMTCTLTPDMDARDALRLMVEGAAAKAPVIENNALVGVLTPSDMVEVVALKNDLAA
jgi:Zn-dependent protease